MRRALSYLLLTTLLLRIAVPVGYMPTSVSGGWYLEICPDGLTPAVMQVFMGEHHHHHHHGSDDGKAAPVFCDLGAGFAAALIDTKKTFAGAVDPSCEFHLEWLEHHLTSSTIWRASARAPPKIRFT